MSEAVKIGNRLVGGGYPTFIVAEIGINHNGDIEMAKKLIDAAKQTGCDAVKFQKRTPAICVPLTERNLVRESPWGQISYLEYRERIEFGREEYDLIDRYCRERNIPWFASCWDMRSVDFVETYDPPCYKIASASLTDDNLLCYINKKNRSMVLSTGMSTMEQIRHAVSLLDTERLIITHSTSAYPCRVEELNLRTIGTLKSEFDCPIGYSGHEVGLQTTVAAVALGAHYIERHITLDRALWGSDQAASVEPHGFARLVKDIRAVEAALGDGKKRVYQSEIANMHRLRRSGSQGEAS